MDTMYGYGQPLNAFVDSTPPVYLAPRPQSRWGTCMGVFLFVLFVGLIAMFLLPGQGGGAGFCSGCAGGDRRHASEEVIVDRRFGTASCDTKTADIVAHPQRGQETPYVPPGTDATSAVDTPNVYPVSSRLNNPHFTTYNQNVYAPSEDFEAYLSSFNPTGLSDQMPLNWRAGGDVGCEKRDADGSKEEWESFGRYSITPQQFRKAEKLDRLMALGLNTREGNAKALGLPSLLHNSLMATSPVPIGNDAFIFNDSSLRQAYIAQATGSFPSLSQC